MPYPHLLRLWMPSPDVPPGTQDAETGKWTVNADAADVVLYDGPADVQDTARRSIRDDAGRPNLNADATAFLADEFVVSGAAGVSSIVAADSGEAVVTDDTASVPMFVVTAGTLRLRARMYATITYEDGTTERATVVGFRRLDGVVLLRRLFQDAA